MQTTTSTSTLWLENSNARLGAWWHKHCRRGEEVCVYSLPQGADADRVRDACQHILDELIEGTTENPSNPRRSSCWEVGDDATYQLLHSPTPDVPVWFGLSEAHASRPDSEGTFVIATDCLWYSPRKLETAVCSRLNDQSTSDFPTGFPRPAKAHSPVQSEANQSTTSMLAEFSVDLAPCKLTEETRAVVAAAWAFAVSRLYRCPGVSIEFLDDNATTNDANVANNHRIVSNMSPDGKRGG